MYTEQMKSSWGFHPMQEAFYNSLRASNPNLFPARVIFSSHEQFKVMILGQQGQVFARVRGHFYHQGQDLPVVGDWVALEMIEGDNQFLPIESVLPRRSCLRRHDDVGGVQSLIANIDFIGLVTSFNDDFNVRRLERGLSMIEDSGAKPIIIVNKCDLMSQNEIHRRLSELQQRIQDVPIVACSAQQNQGVGEIARRLVPGQSVAFLGMSGVGKSTLVNALLEADKMKTQEIRDDDSRGRHTTTHRELILSHHGFWLMDTPGIRSFSFGGDEDSLDESFDDIAKLMSGCRFSDCSHGGEPGCLVGEALGNGDLLQDRWESYLKMKREIEFHLHKGDKQYQSEKKQSFIKRTKYLRQIVRSKKKT
ncbi:MAG: ribosome small subunit-dependent GTPase A [Bdellovibrionaceae bacterium]|nr:ribosome small subunit-dependent GTPase A [Pseudobdellovibrionaceae bacterium]